MVFLKKNNKALKGEGSLQIMSARRLGTCRFVQVIFIIFVAIIVALDLAVRLAVDRIKDPVFNNMPMHERWKLESDDALKRESLTVQRFATLKLGDKIHEGKQAGTKLRTIAKQDLPPELFPDWVPSEEETPVSRYPKALLVGFAKCGTSALLAFLDVHPNIVSLDWEIDYFCERVYFKYSLHWYRMRMPPSTSKQVTLEKSPCYGSEPAALDRIRSFNSSIKIMTIVRDPITRIISHHGQYLASAKVFGREPLPIEDRFIKKGDGKLFESPLLKWGTYNERMEQIYARFPRKQVLVIDGDLFIKDPLPVLKQIESFLGIPSFFSEKDVYMDPVKGFHCPRNRNTMETMCLSENKGRTHVVPSEEFSTRILNYLRPHSLRFFELVGRQFNWTL